MERRRRKGGKYSQRTNEVLESNCWYYGISFCNGVIGVYSAEKYLNSSISIMLIAELPPAQLKQSSVSLLYSNTQLQTFSPQYN